MKRINEKPLTFPIGDKEYVVPPVGWDCGVALVRYLDMPADQLGKVKMKSEDLFKLAMSEGVWEQMRADGVATHLQFRAGLAALAHFQSLAKGATDETALLAAGAVWESGVDPEALAARMAASLQPRAASTTSPGTAGAGSSTRRRANTSGTTSPARKPRGKRST